MLTIKEYKMADSLEEAWQLNQKRSNRILGGMLWMKMEKGSINTGIDLSGLSLDQIEENEEEFSIGCMVNLRQLEQHEGLNAYTQGAVKEAVRHIVGVQFRNLATLGGSIYGRFGFSDVLTVFMVMDSYVELYKGGMVPLAHFADEGCGRDILVRLIVKKRPGKFTYASVRNARTDFPVLTCAAAYLKDEEAENKLYLAVGARPGRAVLLTDENQILKGELTAQKAESFGAYVSEHIVTGSNLRGSREYRKHLAKVLAARAVKELAFSGN